MPIVLLTGASRGIGAATARLLSRAGATVALVGRNAEGLAATARSVEETGGRASIHVVDLATPIAPTSLVENVLEQHGGLDTVINNAAVISPIATIAQGDDASWEQAIAVNLIAPLLIIRAALPTLRSVSGRVICVSSTAADRDIRGLGAYCVTKGAQRHVTSILAIEEPAVTAITYQPGGTDTAMQASIRLQGNGVMTSEQMREYERRNREGELADPHVPARGLAWLGLTAPSEWSGEEILRDDARVLAGVAHLFGSDAG
jgi:NAD(P)-dependent dehydrogenase (short-subunit alcohol dehydrogenase family)